MTVYELIDALKNVPGDYTVTLEVDAAGEHYQGDLATCWSDQYNRTVFLYDNS